MLILARHYGESIQVGDHATLHVRRVDNGTVWFDWTDEYRTDAFHGRVDDYWKFGSLVKVIVFDIRGDQVRFGFIADPSVSIMRTEIVERAAK